MREGRLGDRIYHVPRPGREATRQILACYLKPELPYADTNAEDLIAAATSYLHAPEGGIGEIASATLRSGAQQVIRASHLLSGALLASAVERSKEIAAAREVEREGSGGIRVDDLLSALDQSIAAEARKISVPHVARQMLDLPGHDEIALVALNLEPTTPRHRFMRAA